MFSRISFLAVCCFLAAGIASAAPHISTFAGTGTRGFSGDGGPAEKAQLSNPSDIARGPDGALYICDTDNQRIRKVTPDGTITTFAGNGTRGWSGDGGPATAAALNEPYVVRFDGAGNVFWVERLSHVVRRVDAKSGVISTIAGTGMKSGFAGDGGAATAALLNEPHCIAFDRAGDLFIADIKNHRIRKVEMKTGTITTFAGTGEKKASPDGAPIAGTPLNGPRAFDFDRTGNLWLALREGNAVLRLDTNAGTLHHAAGTGKAGFSAEPQPAKTATFSGPKGVSVGGGGDVFIADTESHSIRVLRAKSGMIELVAGTGVRGDGADGDPLKCQLARPHGVFAEGDGALFIGDSENHRVRIVRP